MNIESHIATIKEHLKAIEAEKQPKKEPKRYLVVEVNDEDTSIKEVMYRLVLFKPSFHWEYELVNRMRKFIESGKIITVNEE